MHVSSRTIVHLTTAELSDLAHKIGNTPLKPVSLLLNTVSEPQKIYLKLENYNPTGSMKDRTGYALIQHLEDQGVLHRDSVIIESTSGNLGVALAFQCKARGYRFVAVIDPKTTLENRAKMETFGAQIDCVHAFDHNGGYLLSRLARVQELCAQYENYVWTNQYASPANPLIHYSTTGPEIYAQMNEHVDVIFAPVSTGGTLAGVGRFFREVSPATQIIGVDAYGSVIFGTSPAPRKLTGIGSSRRSSFLSEDLYDAYMLVKDEEAFAFCRALYAATQLKVGGSSGATLAACARYVAEHPTMQHVVCICADDGSNYTSSIFDDVWLRQQGISLSNEHLGSVRAITVE